MGFVWLLRFVFVVNIILRGDVLMGKWVEVDC